ncbi:MAG: two-component regulator propeller domain-containing protein, partial [Rhodothermales bacterium]
MKYRMIQRFGWARIDAAPCRLVLLVLAFLVVGCPLVAQAQPKTLSSLDPEKSLQQYVHDVWQIEDGLPSNTVYTITQTSDGYLWCGTDAGLARFDGIRFTVFDASNTEVMPNSRISELYEDQSGYLWIGTLGGGLLRYKNGLFTLFNQTNGLAGSTVHALAGDAEGTLWIGTEEGLIRLQDEQFTVFTSEDGLSDNLVMSLFSDGEGRLWISTRDGIDTFEHGTMSAYSAALDLPVISPRSILVDREGTLWFAGYEMGLNRIKDGTLASFTTADGLVTPNIETLFEDRAGTLWIGVYGGGINRLTNGHFSSFTTEDGLSNSRILTIYEDREGSLWIGTEGGGINRFKESRFTTYTTDDGLARNTILALFEDREGILRIGSYGGGVDVMSGEAFFPNPSNEKLPSKLVLSLFEDRDGFLWIAAVGGGASRVKGNAFTSFTTEDGLVNNNVLAFAQDLEGSLWIGTSNGLSRYKNGVFTSFTKEDGLSHDHITTLLVDALGTLWIGTRGGGLNQFDDGTFTSFSTEDGLSHHQVTALYSDNDTGALWIGTWGGGLNRLKDGTITVYNTRSGLHSDIINFIIDDELGHYWMGTNQGLFLVAVDELEQFAAGHIDTITSKAFDAADGLHSVKTNHSAVRTQDGKIWVSTSQGLVMAAPREMRVNHLPPPVVIEEIVGDQTPLNVYEPARLPPGSGNIEFHYAGLSYLAPENLRFKYRLEGYDEDWVDAGTRRSAFYTNLPPDSYEFRVTAQNEDGFWSDTEAVFAFTLAPHFYQAWWFHFLGVLLLGFALYAGYEIRTRTMRARNRALQNEIDERERAERALRESEERFHLAVEGSNDGLWDWPDVHLDDMWWSARFFELLKYKVGELDAGFSHFKNLLHPDDREQAVKALRVHLANEAPFDIGVRLRTRNGVFRWFRARGQALWDESGTPYRMAGSIRDVTDRTRAEAEVRKLNAELEQRVAERTAQLERANKAKSVFLANMSHELRTPLNAILGYAQFMNRDAAVTPTQKEYLGIINRSGEHLLDLINDVLEMSKIEAGRSTLDLSSFDLHEMLTTLEEMFRIRANSKGLEVTFERRPEVPQYILTDARKLRQVLINLVGNAIKFTEEGGVMVHISYAPMPQNDGYTTENAGSLRFEIEDTGPGIAPEEKARLFDAFAQTESSNDTQGGTGLGLTISQRLAHLMGGSISVSSRVGQGSTFTFIIPLRDAAPTDTARRKTHRRVTGLAPGQPAYRILVAEDDAPSRNLLV